MAATKKNTEAIFEEKKCKNGSNGIFDEADQDSNSGRSVAASTNFVSQHERGR